MILNPDPFLEKECPLSITSFFWRFHDFVSNFSHEKFLLWRILLNDDIVIIKVIATSKCRVTWPWKEFHLQNELYFRVPKDGQALWYSHNHFLSRGKALPGLDNIERLLCTTLRAEKTLLCLFWNAFVRPNFCQGGVCHGSNRPRRNLSRWEDISITAHSFKDVLTQLKNRNSVQRGCGAGCWEKEH